MNRPVVVTGIAGFIGPHVARRLLAEGVRVIGIDDFSQGTVGNVPTGVQFIQGDVGDARTLAQLPDDVEAILHLAGQSSGEISFDDPIGDLQKNTISTLQLIRWALRRDVRRFVYASSMTVYGPHPDAPASEVEVCQPLSCYGVGKLASEHYLRLYAKQLPSVVLRMFNVYGPGQDLKNMRQGMVSIFLKMALTEPRVHVKGALDRYRDFVYIDDVVECWTRAMRLPGREFNIINIGTGVRTTVASLLHEMARSVPGMTWYVEGRTDGDQFGIYADTRQLREVLGMGRMTSLAEGLSQFTAWARQALEARGALAADGTQILHGRGG